MATESRFLAAWSAYESAVREIRGCECREYENEASGVLSERLRLCRQVRNYIAHANDKGFAQPSDAMVGCLEQQARVLRGEGDVARKHVVKGCVLAPRTRVDEAVRAMSKKESDWCAVPDGKGFRVVTLFDVATEALRSKTARLEGVKGSRRARTCAADTDAAELSRDVRYVVLDAKGEPLGLFCP